MTSSNPATTSLATRVKDTVYRPLDPRKHEIRLLRLEPGTRDSPIEANLAYGFLGENPEYEALSYIWGDASETVPITVNDDPTFPVTKNLYAALQYLRHGDRGRTLWIDAVCIDQGNPAEKGHQVALMRRIYQQAAMVVAWIDVEVDVDHAAFNKFLTLEEGSHLSDLGNDAEFWLPLGLLFQNSYWSRLWIQQELILARSFQLQCRETIINPWCVMAFQNLVDEKVHREVYQGVYSSKWSTVCSSLFHSTPAGNNLSFWKLMSNQAGPAGAYAKGSLLFCLNSFSQSLQAHEPRDYVYGILGFAADYDDGGIPINYAGSLADTYSTAANFLVQKYRRLLFLPAAGHVLGEGPNRDRLPSWVPDWSNGDQTALTNLHMFHASGELVAETDSILDSRTLRVMGFHLTSVVFSEPLFHPLGNTMDTMTAYIFLFPLVSTLVKRGELLPPLQELLISLARILKEKTSDALDQAISDLIDLRLLASSIIDDEFATRVRSLVGRVLSTIRQHGFSALENNQPLATFTQDVDAWQAQKVDDVVLHDFEEFTLVFGNINLVVTSEGAMGIVSESPIRAGDEVWILFGCPTPMVLRAEGGTYSVLSAACLTGVMKGETVASLPEDVREGHEFGGYTIRRITLI